MLVTFQYSVKYCAVFVWKSGQCACVASKKATLKISAPLTLLHEMTLPMHCAPCSEVTDTVIKTKSLQVIGCPRWWQQQQQHRLCLVYYLLWYVCCLLLSLLCFAVSVTVNLSYWGINLLYDIILYYIRLWFCNVWIKPTSWEDCQYTFSPNQWKNGVVMV